MRRLGIPALGLALALATTPVRAQEIDDDDDGGRNTNAAVVVNTKDGSSRFRLSFRVVRFSGDVLDHTNVAIAFASCEQCRTAAVAVQIVLATSQPSVVTPTNLAIAVNFQCVSCETLASAYQFVLGTGGNVRFTSAGRQALASIRQQMQDLLESDLSIFEIQAQLDALAADLRRVLAEELVAVGPDDTDVEFEDDDDVDEGEEEGEDEGEDLIDGEESPPPTDQPTIESTSTPGATPTESPTESPTTETTPTEPATVPAGSP